LSASLFSIAQVVNIAGVKKIIYGKSQIIKTGDVMAGKVFGLVIVTALLLCSMSVFGDEPAGQTWQGNWQSLDSRPVPQWWRDAKFGIFIHWGVYSVPAWCDGWYAEWYYRLIQEGNSGSPTMIAHHEKTYGADFKYPRFASKFKAEKYDPRDWAKLFNEAGARYVILTSKHHDGFCLWDSPDSKGWNAVDAGPKKDLIAPLAQAVRDENMKFGLYISMMEWDHGDNLPGNRYPKNSDEYVEKHLMPQMKDMVKKYQPSIVWPDGEWDKPSSYWRSEEFLAWFANNAANKDQVVWNDRWGKETRGEHGSFYTTEYGKHGREGGAHPWEENRGIGGSYGYNSWYEDRDDRYPSTQELLDVFVNVLSRGGNFLLNIGPKADGTIIDVFQNRLRDFGRFLRANGEGVYGSSLPFKSEQGDDIKFTCNKNNKAIYAFVKNKPGNSITLNGVFARKGEDVVMLADPQRTPLAWSNQGDNLTIEGIDKVSQHGEFYWVFKIPGGFNADPDAPRQVAGSDLYAYYTRLDYKIPLSEIHMDVPFTNPEQILAWKKRWKIPAIPSGAPEITGKYADIVVHIDENRKLVFARETSYCPWLETPAGRFPFKQLIECQPDPMCLSSYVRIIKNEPNEVLIHWCHVPDPKSIVITEKIHELFAVTPGGGVVRQVKVGTQELEDFQDPANLTVQTLQLTEAGFKELSLSKPELSGKPGEAVDGSPVKKNISTSPAAWLKFDEGLRTRTAAERQNTEESVGGTACTISGNKALWKPGVSGTSLAFDGYFSKVTLPREKAPRVTDELTLEAWVVLGAYPWNDAGIVHQSAGEPITSEAYKHGYQDPYTYRPWEMKGYMLGIDPYGRPMFKVNGRQVGSGEVQPKETVSAKQVIGTYRWVHLAGVYGNGSMSLYMNGELIDQKAASGAIEAPDRDVLVGLNGDAQRISDPVSHSDFATDNNMPMIYGIEGLIDEVKIYDRALSDEQIRESYAAFRPAAQGVDNPSLERRILPGEVTGRPAGKFGATYTTLKYHDLWDNLWRTSPYRDIVVRFDDLPTSVVFWQGTNFGSGWVTEKNQWMSDQSAEIGGPHGCAEHMADKRGRFGHVRLIENTDARVVVHWRYPSIDVGYVFPSADVWADEYYTIYPDGAGIRYVARAKGGWHDTQFLTQAGTTCLDNLSPTALTVANMDGKSADLTWELPNRVPGNPIKDACIKVINFKSNWKVFAIYREGAEIEQWGHSEQSKHTPDAFAGPWNHWPVGLNPSDGRYAVSHDRVTHAAIGGADNVGPFIMYGFTDQVATSLIPLAKSWNRPPKLESPSGCESNGYKQTERAYRLVAKASSMSFDLDGSEKTPIYNPCFVIQKWTNETTSRLAVNGKELTPGKSFRQGITRNTDGTKMLVVWLQLQSTSPVRFTIYAAD
jgi:alpha-L-fucosidase